MQIDQQSAFARAARAWLYLDQKRVAAESSLSERTLLDVEKARACSDKTWAALTAFYVSRGLEIREGEPLMIVVKSSSP